LANDGITPENQLSLCFPGDYSSHPTIPTTTSATEKALLNKLRIQTCITVQVTVIVKEDES
jgi:hypothetical protein